MRPVTVEFTVTAVLNEQTVMTASWWVCGRCDQPIHPSKVRAHLIGHAHEDIGVAS